MCTIFVAFKTVDRFPLTVAANRDESLDRPASGPKLWNQPVRFVAPVDEKAHGSWIGLNAHGVFVAVTNRFLSSRNPERKSRGALVTESLQARSAQALHESMRAVDAKTYNAFHLFYADVNDAFVSWSDDEKITHEIVGPGTHVFTERSFAKEPASRAARLGAMWTELKDREDPSQLFDLLRVHADDDPFSGTCIHAPAFNYGTRSSSVWQVRQELTESQLLSSEGPAHSATPADLSALVRSLAR
jgi:uncharacterized protein with NRDE domain